MGGSVEVSVSSGISVMVVGDVDGDVAGLVKVEVTVSTHSGGGSVEVVNVSSGISVLVVGDVAGLVKVEVTVSAGRGGLTELSLLDVVLLLLGGELIVLCLTHLLAGVFGEVAGLVKVEVTVSTHSGGGTVDGVSVINGLVIGHFSAGLFGEVAGSVIGEVEVTVSTKELLGTGGGGEESESEGFDCSFF